MNNIVILGYVTKDLELKETASGVKYVRFSIAVSRKFKNEEGEYEADFFNVVAWRKTAEYISEYSGKGKRIAISGRLQNSNYTDKDGNDRISTEIVANEVQIIDKIVKDNNSVQEEETTLNEAKNSELDDAVFAEFGDSIEIDDSEIAF